MELLARDLYKAVGGTDRQLLWAAPYGKGYIEIQLGNYELDRGGGGGPKLQPTDKAGVGGPIVNNKGAFQETR